MVARLLIVTAALAAFSPASASSQQVCDLMPEPRAREATRLAAPDGERIYIRGPARFECTGGVTVRADSAVSYSGRGELHLVGSVFYGDSIKTLTADWVNYFGRDGRLFARGSVVLTDRESESVIRGGELEYHGASERRPETRTIVRGSPTAVLYPSSRPEGRAPLTDGDAALGRVGGIDPAPPRPAGTDPPGPPPTDADTPEPPPTNADPPEPFHVDADRMEILGEHYFHAEGNVVLRRGDTRGWSRDAVFDQTDERLVLTGDARILDDDFELTGARIQAFLDDDALREVEAEDEAVLLAEDLRIDAAVLRIFFDDGALHRLVARSGSGAPAAPPPPGGPMDPLAMPAPDASTDPPATPAPDGQELLTPTERAAPALGVRPLVTATDFRLEADSIDAYLPGQTLERVIAVGAAFGERFGDSIDASAPSIIANDWVRGDTITGYFVAVASDAEPEQPDQEADRIADTGAQPARPESAPAEPESAPAEPALERDEAEDRERVALERLVAAAADGSQASALYRMRDEADEERLAANYLVAVRITLWLVDGQVSEMEADGPIRGIYIDPVNTDGAPAAPVAARERRNQRR